MKTKKFYNIKKLLIGNVTIATAIVGSIGTICSTSLVSNNSNNRVGSTTNGSKLKSNLTDVVTETVKMDDLCIEDLSDGGCTNPDVVLTLNDTADGFIITSVSGAVEVSESQGNKITLKSIVTAGTYTDYPIVGISANAFAPVDASFTSGKFQTKILDLSQATNLEYIGNGAFKSNTYLNQVILADPTVSPASPKLSVIYDNAFSSCTNLTAINFDDATYLNSIGSSAFANTGLTELEFNATGATYSLTTIYSNAFQSCTNLTSVVLPSSTSILYGGTFCDCTNLETWSITEGTTLSNIPASTFKKDAKLESFTLPSNITSIDEHAFEACVNLTSIELSNAINLVSIGNSAFYKSGLESIDLSPFGTAASDFVIGDNAFKECTSLSSVSLPKYMDYIRAGAFASCSALNYLSITSDDTTWVNETYSEVNDEWISDVADEVTVSVPTDSYLKYVQAFDNCDWDKLFVSYDVVVDNSIIGDANLFFTGAEGKISFFIDDNNDITITDATKLKATDPILNATVTYDKKECNITTIAKGAFILNEDISGTVTLSDKYLTYIGAQAFMGCTNISAIDLSVPTTDTNNLESIGTNAFAGCTNLTSVTIGKADSLQNIGTSAFAACPLETFDFPGNDTYQVQNFTDKGGKVIGGCVYTNSEESNSWTNDSKVVGSIAYGTIDFNQLTDVTEITESQFSMTNISEVIISNKITDIGTEAFMGCAYLVTIDLTNAASLKQIGTKAFALCIQLTNISFAETTNVTDIGLASFAGDISLQSVDLSKSVNLEAIHAGAFAGCLQLTSFVFPKNLIGIGAGAFSFTAIKDINLPDNQDLDLTYFDDEEREIIDEYIDMIIPFLPEEIEPYIPYIKQALEYFENLIGPFVLCDYKSIHYPTSWYSYSNFNPYNVLSFKNGDALLLQYQSEWTNVTIPVMGSLCGDIDLSDNINLSMIMPFCFFGDLALTSVELPRSLMCITPLFDVACLRLQSITFNNTNAAFLTDTLAVEMGIGYAIGLIIGEMIGGSSELIIPLPWFIGLDNFITELAKALINAAIGEVLQKDIDVIAIVSEYWPWIYNWSTTVYFREEIFSLASTMFASLSFPAGSFHFASFGPTQSEDKTAEWVLVGLASGMVASGIPCAVCSIVQATRTPKLPKSKSKSKSKRK